jgi:hypothetical protein
VRLGALDGEAGAGEAAGAAVVGEAPLLHQPRTRPDQPQARPDQRARRRGRAEDREPGRSLARVAARHAVGSVDRCLPGGGSVVVERRAGHAEGQGGAFIAAWSRGGESPGRSGWGRAAPRIGCARCNSRARGCLVAPCAMGPGPLALSVIDLWSLEEGRHEAS